MFTKKVCDWKVVTEEERELMDASNIGFTPTSISDELRTKLIIAAERALGFSLPTGTNFVYELSDDGNTYGAVATADNEFIIGFKLVCEDQIPWFTTVAAIGLAVGVVWLLTDKKKK